MIIDSHAHFIPPSLLAAIQDRAGEFAALSLIHDESGSFGFSFAGSKPTRPASKMLSDTKGRLEWMDANQIDRQVIGGWLDMFGYELPVDEGQRWSVMINEHLGQFCAENDRFLPLAPPILLDRARCSRTVRGFRASDRTVGKLFQQ